MEHGPFEDVFPIENGDFPASYVSLPEGNGFPWCVGLIAFGIRIGVPISISNKNPLSWKDPGNPNHQTPQTTNPNH